MLGLLLSTGIDGNAVVNLIPTLKSDKEAGDERSGGFADDLRGVAHLAEFVEHSVDAAGANEEGTIREPPRDFLGQLLAREALLRQHRVLGEHQANPSMQLRGKSGAGVHR